MLEPSVSAGLARALMDIAVARGADRTALLVRSRIDLGDLANPDDRVALTKYMVLMRVAKELSRDSALALHFGETFDLADVSVVGLVGRGARLASEAMSLVNRYGPLALDIECTGTDRFAIHRQRGEVWLVDTRSAPNTFPEITEALFARAISTCRRMFGERRLVKAVRVTHPEPDHRAEYDRVFQVPVEFSSDMNALQVDGSWPGLRMRGMSPYAVGLFNAHAEALLAKLGASKSIRGRVEALVRPMLPNGRVRVTEVARRLSMSRQTLFRRLKAEGVTFERLVDEVRYGMAVHYLCSEQILVRQASQLLGFSDPSAFSRAFKRWAGLSPRTYAAKGASTGRSAG